MAQKIQEELAILRLPIVKARTGLSRSTIYLFVSEGNFPKPIGLGLRAVGWIENEVTEWIAQRIAASRSQKCPIAMEQPK